MSTSPNAYTSWDPPVAWLYGNISTDHPGNRTLRLDGEDVTVPSAYQPFPEFFASVDDELQDRNHYLTADENGSISIYPDTPETGYLSGDGVGWVRIPGALSGYTTTYAVVAKYQRMPTSYASWPALLALSNPSAPNNAGTLPNITDYLHVQATGPQYRFRGITTAGAQNYASSGTLGVTSGRQVHSITRLNVGVGPRTAKARVFDASGASWMSASATATQDNNPSDIHLLAFATSNNTLVQPPAPSDAQLVAVVVLHREPTDDELRAYAHVDCHDAVGVWGADIRGYWTAKDVIGTQWPARIGTADGVLVSLDDADYTALFTDLTAPIKATDRLLALLGYDVDVGEDLPRSSALSAPGPSPVCVPLAHCTWEVVDRAREREFALDRFLRGHGDTFGDAETWRLSIRLEEPAYRALETGWCLAGAIMVSPFSLHEHLAATATPWSPTNPHGYIVGRVMGLEPGTWVDGTGPRRFWEGSLLIQREVE